jgi:predicted ATPase/class 3 adenylate cyclase
MAAGLTLPERTSGAALFADISGFTPLTEALARELGPKRGAEELTVHLNRVYDALIGDLHRFGGSVIGFAGDAVTCWLDGDDGRRATACALVMQQTMRQFAEVTTYSGRVVSLGLKVAVATGPVRRFVVGYESYALVDVMAGQTLERMANAEHQAERGEVVLHGGTAAALGDLVDVAEWREEQDGDRYAVVTGLATEVPASPWPELAEDALTEAQEHGWLLPAVYQRLHAGKGEFLAELRPATALFLRFTGLHYDEDESAPDRLNSFICSVMDILMRYDGSLIQLTVGDKGSYLYAAFGAPMAHEDDTIRAAAAALDMQKLASSLDYLDPVQIGITVGRMRTGAYGSATRRTYGVLGDATNLSARLMAAARPGQILVSDEAKAATGSTFVWENLPNMRVKGKSEPVTLARLVSRGRQQSTRLHEPKYSLPMVGREDELALIETKIDQALLGKGQIVGLTAEAGLGKSRLAAEIVALATDRGMLGFAGECQSYGADTSYLPWHGVWRNFFKLDSTRTLEQQAEQLAQELAQIDQALVPRLPLLGPAVNLSLPDTDLTEPLEAKVRKSILEAMLVECLRDRATVQPLLIVLEDCHWIDPLSRDLIAAVGRALAGLPVLLLLIYRPPDREREQAPLADGMPHFTEVALSSFSSAEAERLIDLKMRQFLGEETAVPADFVADITRRAAGNPFYIEEMLNYLRDLGVHPSDTARLAEIDLPDSIYTLILSRIDQLNRQQQITIRVASVIGRLFRAAMVWGVYPELRDYDQIHRDLDVLSVLDLTALDAPEPEITYLFRQVMTQEVAYESLLFSTRAFLHEQVGRYIEYTYPENLDRYVTLLAYHFEHSNDEARKREYLLKAGVASQREYANTAALNYYRKVLPLLSPGETADVHIKLGDVYQLIGKWDEARSHYLQAVAQAEEAADEDTAAWSQTALGELSRKQSRYDEALDWLEQARRRFELADDRAGIGQTLHYAGTVAAVKGDYELARSLYDESMRIREELDDRASIGSLYNNLGIVARLTGDYEQAQSLHEKGLAMRREVGDRWAIANSLTNLGTVLVNRSAYEEAQDRLDEALRLYREIGDPWQIALAINNLGGLARRANDLETAEAHFRSSLLIWRDLGEAHTVAQTLNGLGVLAVQRGRLNRALQLTGAATAIRANSGAPLSVRDREELDRLLAPAKEALGEEAAAAAWQAGQTLTLEAAISLALDNQNRTSH